MCGIAGIYSQSSDQAVEEPRLWSMLTTMRHRGPDGDGTWLHPKGLGLGHVRLAVIDLSTASNQPFVSGDGNFVLTYNGEIFNYLELRHELEGMGHRFRTASDTEVLLTAYRQWGQGRVRTAEWNVGIRHIRLPKGSPVLFERPVWYQAVLLCIRGWCFHIRVGSEGADGGRSATCEARCGRDIQVPEGKHRRFGA